MIEHEPSDVHPVPDDQLAEVVGGNDITEPGYPIGAPVPPPYIPPRLPFERGL